MTALKGGFEFLSQFFIGKKEGKIPERVFVCTYLAVDVAEDVFVGAIQDGKGQLEFDLERREREIVS
jgi:hypothetical protein